MLGTMKLETLPIERTPRIRTANEQTTRTTPVASVEMPSELNAELIEFACVMLPIPNDAQTAKIANSVAINFPNAPPMPFFIAYMGPPAISPTELVSRYLTARTDSPYLVDRPNAALIHIQIIAPGPPRTIAVATPTILPVPTVAESAVISDWNGDRSPCLSVLCCTIIFTAYQRFIHGKNFSRIVRKMPVPTRNASIIGPHTKSLMSFNSCDRSIKKFPSRKKTN